MKSVSAIFGGFSTWANHHVKTSIALTAAAVLIGGGIIVGAAIYPSPQAAIGSVVEQVKPKPEPPATKYYSPLTGLEVVDQAATTKQVKAVIIENSPSARPQSGLFESGIIFEAIAEGGITRLLTMHQEAQPSLIGPVRSLRPYYIDWLAPFDATVSHVGGSANALKEIRNGNYKDDDQFFNGKYYWRAKDRAAPHNVYTDTQNLDAMNASKGYTSSKFTPWPRKLDSAATTPNATKIDITVSSALYNVHYDYDNVNNNYIRSLGGAKHIDREKGQIAPKVVVALKVPTSVGFEDGYRTQMDTNGTGTAYIFQDGTVTEAIWQKTNQKAQIRFYDKLGKPVPFNAGQVWLTVVAPNKAVTWQQ